MILIHQIISIINLINMSNKLVIDSAKQNYVTLDDNYEYVKLSKIKFIFDEQINPNLLSDYNFMTQEFNIVLNSNYNCVVTRSITDFVFANIIGKCKIKISIEHNTISLKPKRIILDTCITQPSKLFKNILVYTNGLQYHHIVTFEQTTNHPKNYNFTTTSIRHMGDSFRPGFAGPETLRQNGRLGSSILRDIIWHPRFIISIILKNNTITHISYRVNWDHNIEEENQQYLTKDFGDYIICIIPIQYHTGHTCEYINFDSIAELKNAIKTTDILKTVKYFSDSTTNMTKPDITLSQDSQNFTYIVSTRNDMTGTHVDSEGSIVLDT